MRRDRKSTIERKRKRISNSIIGFDPWDLAIDVVACVLQAPSFLRPPSVRLHLSLFSHVIKRRPRFDSITCIFALPIRLNR